MIVLEGESIIVVAGWRRYR